MIFKFYLRFSFLNCFHRHPRKWCDIKCYTSTLSWIYLYFFSKFLSLQGGDWNQETWQHSNFGTPVSCVCSLKFVRTENFHRTLSVVPIYFLWSLAAWFNILRDAKYASAHLVMYRQLEFSVLRSGGFLAFKRIEEYADFSTKILESEFLFESLVSLT